MFKFIETFIENRKKKKRLKVAGCYCSCPECDKLLTNWDPYDDFGQGSFTCDNGHVSKWDFCAAPVPLVITEFS